MFSQQLEEARVAIHWIDRQSRFSFAASREIRRRALSGEYHAIIVFLVMPAIYAEIGMLGCRSTRLIVSERSSFRFGKPSFVEWGSRQLHRVADVVTTNSHNQQVLLERHCPWLRGKVRTIYNGYDLERFRPRPRDTPFERLELVCVGRITEGKNIECIVHALSDLKREGLNVRITLIGRLDDSRWASGYYQHISDMIDNLGVGDRWRWLGERTDVAELLPTFDGLLHSSHYEGLPNAVCEAMACGLPVLASRVCDHPRLIGEDERGWLFDPDNSSEMAARIKQLCFLSPQARAELSVRTRLYAEQTLSIEKMCVEYESVIFS